MDFKVAGIRRNYFTSNGYQNYWYYIYDYGTGLSQAKWKNHLFVEIYSKNEVTLLKKILLCNWYGATIREIAEKSGAKVDIMMR